MVKFKFMELQITIRKLRSTSFPTTTQYTHDETAYVHLVRIVQDLYRMAIDARTLAPTQNKNDRRDLKRNTMATNSNPWSALPWASGPLFFPSENGKGNHSLGLQ